jgi:hypothetical protein
MSDLFAFAHGEVLVKTQAFCRDCAAFQPLGHFDPGPFIEAHPRAAQGISGRDYREWQRGWGGDGRSGHRALRYQMWLRSRPSGGNSDGPNVLDSLAKGVRAPKV